MVSQLPRIVSPAALIAALSCCDFVNAPSADDAINHIAKTLPILLTIKEAKCENFPDKDGNQGRISCKGHLVLSQSLYKNSYDDFDNALRKIIGDNYWYYRDVYMRKTKHYKYYGIAANAGTTTQFDANLYYRKVVDGWHIEGRPSYNGFDGYTIQQIQQQQPIIVGTSEYESAIAAIVSLRDEDQKIASDLVAEMQNYFSNKKTFTLTQNWGNDKRSLHTYPFDLELRPATSAAQNIPSSSLPINFIMGQGFSGSGQARWTAPGRFGNSSYAPGDVIPVTYNLRIGLLNGKWLSGVTVVMQGKNGWGASQEYFVWNGKCFKNETRHMELCKKSNE